MIAWGVARAGSLRYSRWSSGTGLHHSTQVLAVFYNVTDPHFPFFAFRSGFSTRGGYLPKKAKKDHVVWPPAFSASRPEVRMRIPSVPPGGAAPLPSAAAVGSQKWQQLCSDAARPANRQPRPQIPSSNPFRASDFCPLSLRSVALPPSPSVAR